MCQKNCFHYAEVAKDFQCCTTDCVFCNVIALLVVGSGESLGTRLGYAWARDYLHRGKEKKKTHTSENSL